LGCSGRLRRHVGGGVVSWTPKAVPGVLQGPAACVALLLGLMGWVLWAWTLGSGFVGPRL
jgi:hypothetical protein